MALRRLLLKMLDPGGASDGDALVFDEATNRWGPGSASGGSSSGGFREVLMESGVSDPAVPLESSDGGDWLYGIRGGTAP